MFTRSQYKINAKEVLKKNYLISFLVTLIVLLLNGAGPKLEYRVDSTAQVMRWANTLNQWIIRDPSFTWHGEYGPAMTNALATFVQSNFLIILMTSFIITCLAIAFGVFVVNILNVGKRKYFLEAKDGRYEFGALGFMFRNQHYMNVVKIAFVRNLILFLWSLLFIIPGIIAYYRYFFVDYILSESPGMDRADVFALAKDMSNGIKMDLFILDLSFFGWHLLNMITFGLAVYFYTPYLEATYAEVYRAYQHKRNTEF